MRPAPRPAIAESREPAWLWDMTRYQWLVFLAAWLGWGFDVFDGLLFNFVAPVCVPRLLGVPAGDPRVTAATGAITSTLLVTSAPFGILLAGVANDLFTQQIAVLAAHPDLAWRVVFLSGLVPAAVALWIRRQVREPEVWRRERAGTPRLRELFTPALRRATLGGLAMSLVTLVSWWATNAFLPWA
ncbi:MAG: MFS transporter [Deltaproteobacteria bacterium]|nr:MAG: MFS transporter [Deltaproteobacteria bacterium]